MHLRNGFFVQNGGFEHPAVLAVAAAAIELTGAGRYAIDHVLGWHLHGWRWAGGGPTRAGAPGASGETEMRR